MEHRSTLESRDITVDHPVYPETVVQVRFVCSCGTATRWHKSTRNATLEAVAHALDGQRELAL